ncbi:hypothetical protein LEP1GSC043_1247 [Leptospira weilii str. Ecochallenge]|uniref:Uncharacterized protein n=2 Tax=Leptospira weilii TaxID=28184 RepID=N1U8G2_9LEPT|nr:hypothetical protein LEP1GSC108_1728 [Leptospira weilii str. UI 13098]EMY14456.1 hypothetical protein LEP1GSC043_1247 [Leptospira weilii str. Ecochallenge]
MIRMSRVKKLKFYSKSFLKSLFQNVGTIAAIRKDSNKIE